MRFIVLVFSSMLALALAAVLAQAPAPTATTSHYTTTGTQIGQILDDPAARAIVNKRIPGVIDNDQIEMARQLTLKDLQQYSGDKMPDKALADIDAEFAKIPAIPAKP